MFYFKQEKELRIKTIRHLQGMEFKYMHKEMLECDTVEVSSLFSSVFTLQFNGKKHNSTISKSVLSQMNKSN